MIIANLTTDEFKSGLAKSRSVIIPFGSVEAHGSHLPLATDTFEAYQVAVRAAELRPVFVAPAVMYGNCRSTGSHPGTISISTSTLKSLFIDIATSLRSHGIRNVIALSGHAGGAHCMALQDAGEELVARFDDISVAVLTEYQLALSRCRGIVETPGDSHAGEIETSRIMHSHPHLVKGTSPEEYPAFPTGLIVRDKLKFWPGSVWGNPAKASAEKGALIERAVVDALLEFVEQMEACHGA